jgi:hypothetical protein
VCARTVMSASRRVWLGLMLRRYMRAAHHAATVLYDRRSPLGLVGSSFHVGANTWSHAGSTIGPGSDSYYEYLLKVC